MKTTMLLVAFVLAIAIPCRAAEQADSQLSVGLARVCITPDRPLWLRGYASKSRFRPFEGKLNDLYAKALALEDEAGQRVVIVTLDLIGVLVTLRESVEKQVQEQYQLPPAALVLNASHTHCGPEYRERTGREEEARTYHQFLETTLVRLVGESLADLRPARLTYSHARAGFAMNRRRNYALPKEDVNANKAPNPDGPVDHDVPVLCVLDAEGNQRAVLFGYACHNTTLGFYQFCGDYAGFAQLGLFLHQAMRQPDRVGHEVRGFVAGITEHQALVAGADVAAGQGDALVNLDRLVIEAHLHFAGVRIDAGFGIAVTDVAQHLAGNRFGAITHLVEEFLADGFELAGNHHQVVGDEGFAGDLGFGFFGQKGIEDGVGNLVGDLVRMAFGNGLGGKQMAAHIHGAFPVMR